jgi:pimeloyl-[acyl-carrier protein] methyl ester esterase
MLPILVLLPGLDGTGDLFAPFLSCLKAAIETKVVRYPADSRLDYSALIDLAGRQLPEDRPFILLAESFSGPIAICLAAAKPKNLAGLILCATFARHPYQRLRYLGPLLNVIPLRSLPFWSVKRFLLSRFGTEDLEENIKRVVGALDPKMYAKRLQESIRVNVSGELEQLSVPLLYLSASDDRLVPYSAAKVFSRPEREWQVKKIVGPHLLLQAVPADTADEVMRFLQSFE